MASGRDHALATEIYNLSQGRSKDHLRRSGLQQEELEMITSGTKGRTNGTYPDMKEPDVMFATKDIEYITERLLVKRLYGLKYDPVLCKKISKELATEIMEKLKTLKLNRYKLVAVVSIGNLDDSSSFQFGSRCLWDQSTDRFASVKFNNSSIFAVAMIYGLSYT